jgi:hypothetical protein
MISGSFTKLFGGLKALIHGFLDSIIYGIGMIKSAVDRIV